MRAISAFWLVTSCTVRGIPSLLTMNAIDRAAVDLQLAWLVAQLSRRGLDTLIPHILSGARWEIDRGRLWVYVGDRAEMQIISR